MAHYPKDKTHQQPERSSEQRHISTRGRTRPYSMTCRKIVSGLSL